MVFHLASPYPVPELPAEVNLDIPVCPVEDAYTLSRALALYEQELPPVIRGVVHGAVEVAEEYTRTQITLSKPVPDIPDVATPVEAIAEERKPVLAAEHTGDLPISLEELFGDKEPTLADKAVIAGAVHELAERASIVEFREEHAEALRRLRQLRFNARQAAIADLALRRLARHGDVAAVDIATRRPEILEPDGNFGSRLMALPLSALLLACSAIRVK